MDKLNLDKPCQVAERQCKLPGCGVYFRSRIPTRQYCCDNHRSKATRLRMKARKASTQYEAKRKSTLAEETENAKLSQSWLSRPLTGARR